MIDLTRRAPRGARGVTLIELMVAAAASLVVIMGALALVTSQQQAFQATSADRTLQETGRVVIDELTSHLRLAGFGVEPALAFDFGEELNVPMPQAPEGTTGKVGGHACATPVSCRDRIDEPDEIVFLERDPYFTHTLSHAYGGTGSLRITGPLRAPLLKGQILQVMCLVAPYYWAYVQVASDVTAESTLAANEVPVPIETTAGTDFPRQADLLAQACFGNVAPVGSSAATIASAATVTKIDRYRYFIQSYDVAGTLRPWKTQGARPFLMLDRGLTGSPQVIAPDVEDLQLMYQLPNSPAELQLQGANTSVAIPAGDQGIDLAPAAGVPVYGVAANDPSRLSQHPANIRAVRLGVVVRSPEADATLTGGDGTTIPANGNRPATEGPTGYRRLLLQTTVAVRNMAAQVAFYR